MRVTLFRDTKALSKRERELTFTELAELILATEAPKKHDLPLVKLGTFGDEPTDRGCLRHDENLREVCGVECDYDYERVPFDTAVAQARAVGALGILYTSPSHTPEKPRWRALFPFSTSMSPSRRGQYADRANAIFDGVLSRETWTLSQSFYYGRARDNEHFQLIVLQGTPIDLLDFDESAPFAKPQRERAVPPPVEAGGSVEDLPPKIKRAIKSGDPTKFGLPTRNHLVFLVACGLVRAGWSDERGAALLLDRDLSISQHVYDQRGRTPEAYARKQMADARAKIAEDWNRRPNGSIIACDQQNVRRAIENFGIRCFDDTFRGRTYLNGRGPTRELSDKEAEAIWLEIDREFGFLPTREFVRSILENMGYANQVHPVRERLAEIQPTWDGVPRIGDAEHPGWLTTYGQAEDSEYVRAVSRLILVAAVRRVREPGVKFDQMLVLVDPNQGTGKSTAALTLALEPAWFTDSLPMHVRDDKQVIEQLSGRWIVECAELSGMRHADVETLKGFVVRQTDRARLAYGHFPVDAPRQCIFIGTTNSETFLRDTQNRRFWPVRTGRFDVEALRRDVIQLWAEAAAAETSGESIALPEPLWAVAAEVQQEYRADDAWAQAISEKLMDLPGKITTSDVWEIIGKPVHMRQQHENSRLGDAMRELGFTRKKARAYGKLSWCYVRPADDPSPLQIYVLRDIDNKLVVSHSPTGDDPSSPPYDQDQGLFQREPGEDEDDIPYQ